MVLLLVLLSIDLSRGKHLEMACSKGTLNGDELILSLVWLLGLVVYLNGLIDLRLLSLTKGCFCFVRGVWVQFRRDPAVEAPQVVKSYETRSARIISLTD